MSLYSSHLKTSTAWFNTFPPRGTLEEAFRPGNVPMTFSSALPICHHAWLSLQRHVACRRSSQQVGSYFAHQHPHLEVCAFDRGKATLSILNRSIYSFSKHSWLALLRSPFGFPLVWRCVIQRISYSSSYRVAVFSQDCSAHSWRQNVPLLIHNGLPNMHGWSVGRVGGLAGWSGWSGWSVGRLVGWSVGRSVGRSVCWFVGLLVCWSCLGLRNEHALFRTVPKVLNRSVLSFSLKPSISTPSWTAGYPCVVLLELACSFPKDVYVLLNLSESGAN